MKQTTIIDAAMDQKLIDLMLTSKNIKEWNENRESAKALRSTEWISQNIDSALLIKKTEIQ
jgi:hypothetical protein